jgi:hypothetical protein
MKKFIITTTILPPTKAIEQYDAMEDWSLIVTGDRKSPKEYPLKRGLYVDWEAQQKGFPDLCNLIGPDSTARGRMIAIIMAYRAGADVIATIDDDNFPYDNWGKKCHIGTTIGAHVKPEKIYEPVHLFDIRLWHRGFPIELRNQEWSRRYLTRNVEVLMQANLWDCDPDIDALMRLALRPDIRIGQNFSPFCGSLFMPMNSQNTMFAAKYAMDYCPFAFIGRLEDIWASYVFQALHPNSSVYCEATVRHEQVRSLESLLKDLEDEIWGYRNTYQFLKDLAQYGVEKAMENTFPFKARVVWEMYRRYFE